MTRKNLIFAAAIAAIAFAAAIVGPQKFAPGMVPDAQAATPNVSVGGAQVMVLPLQFSGAYTTTTTAAEFAMPMPCSMIGAGATARLAGAAPNNVDVQLGGVSILSGLIALDTGVYAEGTISTATITDEGVITVILGAPGGTITDVTVLLTCVRK